MEKTFKKLDKLRVEISGHAFRAEVLFKTILNHEINGEIIALSELGMHACKHIRKHSEELEFALGEIEEID